MMKRTILFILPGIAGVFPRRWQKRLKLRERNPLLQEFFNFARREERSPGFRGMMEHHFKVDDHASWAYLGIRGEGLQINSLDWLKISLIDQNNYINYDVDLIRELAKDFAQEFSYAEDSIVSSRGNWYMSLGGHRNIRSTPLMRYWGDELNPYQLRFTGRDAPIWQGRLNEARRWLELYSKEKQLQRPIRLLWPWGARDAMRVMGTPKFSAVFSDNVLFRGLGEHLRLSFFKQSYLLADPSQMFVNHPQLSLVDDSLYRALSEQRFRLWFKARELFVETYLAPMMEGIKSGLVDEIIIDDLIGNIYRYDKGLRLPFKRGEIKYYYRERE